MNVSAPSPPRVNPAAATESRVKRNSSHGMAPCLRPAKGAGPRLIPSVPIKPIRGWFGMGDQDFSFGPGATGCVTHGLNATRVPVDCMH